MTLPSKQEVRRLLESSRLFVSASESLTDDAELQLDSMSLVWFLTLVEREFGLTVGVEDVEPMELTSVSRIHRWLERLEDRRRGRGTMPGEPGDGAMN